jgi:uncharacterized protein YecE (DUF72 family)
MTIFIGTSGWSYAHWRGGFYPADMAQSHWLAFYTKHFDSVEVNATFYRRFADTTYYHWHDKAPEGFRYTLKVPRLISHRHHLLDVDDQIVEFCRSSGLLQEKLGMLLLQLPPDMPYSPERLAQALKAFAEPSRVAVEFRNECWHTKEAISLLREFGACYCNADYPGHLLNDVLTGNSAYLRLHGRRAWYADNYQIDELKTVAGMARDLETRGARDVYIYFNNDYGGYAPANAAQLVQYLSNMAG